MATSKEARTFVRRQMALVPASGSASDWLCGIPEGVDVHVTGTIIGEGRASERFHALLRKALPFLVDKVDPHGIRTAEDLFYALRASHGYFRRIHYHYMDMSGKKRRGVAMRYHTLSPACIKGRKTDVNLLALLRCLDNLLEAAPEYEGKARVVNDVRHAVSDMEFTLQGGKQ